MNPYNVLGIKPGSTQEEIKAAYKRLASEHHPDKANGTHARMQAINAAYEALTGKPNGKPDIESLVKQRFARAFVAALSDGFGGTQVNIAGEVINSFLKDLSTLTAKKVEIQMHIEAINKNLDRFEGIYSEVVEDMATGAGGQLANVLSQIEAIELCLELSKTFYDALYQ